MEKGYQNLLLKIRDMDLLAKEAWYHSSCRRNYTRKEDRNKKSVCDAKAKASIFAHGEAFDYICKVVDRDIIRYGNIKQLNTLISMYQSFLEEHHPDFCNANYKSYKLHYKSILNVQTTKHTFGINH